MKIKQLEVGMVVHLKNINEFTHFCQEATQQGFNINMSSFGKNPEYMKINDTKEVVTWTQCEEQIEFSDLVIEQDTKFSEPEDQMKKSLNKGTDFQKILYAIHENHLEMEVLDYLISYQKLRIKELYSQLKDKRASLKAIQKINAGRNTAIDCLCE